LKKIRELSAAEAVAGLVALAALLVSLVYVLGGLTLALRLTVKGLPAETVVGGLPREFLITQGLGVLYQLLLFLAVMWLSLVPSPQAVWRKRLPWVAGVGAGVLALPLFRSEWSEVRDRGELVTVPVIVAAAVTAVLLWWRIRAVVTTRRGETWIGLAGRLTILFVVVFALWRVVLELEAGRILEAKVCTKDIGLAGLFIGENSDSVYIGEQPSVYFGEQDPRNRGSPQVVVVPRESVEILVIGVEAGNVDCPGD